MVDKFGMLPPVSAIRGVPTGSMVVMHRVRVPYYDNPAPQLHIFPSKHLADPFLPRLPVGLTPKE
jgi:hypothetical protein